MAMRLREFFCESARNVAMHRVLILGRFCLIGEEAKTLPTWICAKSLVL